VGEQHPPALEQTDHRREPCSALGHAALGHLALPIIHHVPKPITVRAMTAPMMIHVLTERPSTPVARRRPFRDASSTSERFAFIR
jgi:hypothetical protein